jgi:hypothetical protein
MEKKFGAFPDRTPSESERVAERLRELREFLADRQRDLADNELYETELRTQLHAKIEERQCIEAFMDASRDPIVKDGSAHKIGDIEAEIKVIENELSLLGQEDQDNESSAEDAKRALSEAQDQMKKHLN